MPVNFTFLQQIAAPQGVQVPGDGVAGCDTATAGGARTARPADRRWTAVTTTTGETMTEPRKRKSRKTAITQTELTNMPDDALRETLSSVRAEMQRRGDAMTAALDGVPAQVTPQP